MSFRLVRCPDRPGFWEIDLVVLVNTRHRFLVTEEGLPEI